MIPIVLHIPHASRLIPAEERADFVLDDAALERELTAMTDAWTDELVEGWSDRYTMQRVIAPVSRLVCDVERFRDDSAEPMAARGMGAVYTRTSDGRPLRTATPEERERILRTYYDPHHVALTRAVDEALAEAGACLIIDVHSFPSKPLPYEPDQSPDRPEICIGFDDFHGAFLADGGWDAACRHARFQGAANRPFSGSIVPVTHLHQNRNVLSAMIEVRRDLYMDEETGRKLDRFDEVKFRLGDVAVFLGERATEAVERARLMALPYEQRVPLVWAKNDDGVYRRIVKALEPDELRELRSEAKRTAREALSGRGPYADPVRRPGADEECRHLARAIQHRLLLDAAWERLQDEGEVIDEYIWDGEGLSTSPGSSYYACVKEWNGIYGAFGEVDAEGPFLSREEAVRWMEDHVGLSEKDRFPDEGPGWRRDRRDHTRT
jgi:N-formylglutamate deformylase